MSHLGLSLDEDRLSCSVCLDLLKDPVTIPCGHSYCMNCIKNHWNEEDPKSIYSCPQCRETFIPRPVVGKNTMLSDLVEEMKKSGLQAPQPHSYAGAGDVACDFCTGRKLKATKSCLQCLASYCQLHLQPHYDSPTFQKHKLVEASAKIQENICPRHNKVKEIFCRSDQQAICYLCSVEQHKGHDTVYAATERADKQRELAPSRLEIRQRIQDREADVKLLQTEVECLNDSADEAAEETRTAFSQLVQLLETRSAEVLQKIQSQKDAVLDRVRELQNKLQQEIGELRGKDVELEQLSRSEDHCQFLVRFPSLLALGPTSDPLSTKVRTLAYFQELTVAVAELAENLQDLLDQDWTQVTEAELDALLTTTKPKPGPSPRVEPGSGPSAKGQPGSGPSAKGQPGSGPSPRVEPGSGLLQQVEPEPRKLRRAETEPGPPPQGEPGSRLSQWAKPEPRRFSRAEPEPGPPPQGEPEPIPSLRQSLTRSDSEPVPSPRALLMLSAAQVLPPPDYLTPDDLESSPAEPLYMTVDETVSLPPPPPLYSDETMSPETMSPPPPPPVYLNSQPQSGAGSSGSGSGNGTGKGSGSGAGAALQPVPLTQPEAGTRAAFLQFSCQLTLDPNTANRLLALSGDNRRATRAKRRQWYFNHAERFTDRLQVLTKESLTGRCYWEVEWTGIVSIAVAYRDISRTGMISGFGDNNKSWALYCHNNKLIHNKLSTVLTGTLSSRVGVFLDHRGGILSFYSVSETMTLLQTIQTTFTQPLHVGLCVGSGSAEILQLL